MLVSNSLFPYSLHINLEVLIIFIQTKVKSIHTHTHLYTHIHTHSWRYSGSKSSNNSCDMENTMKVSSQKRHLVATSATEAV